MPNRSSARAFRAALRCTIRRSAVALLLLVGPALLPGLGLPEAGAAAWQTEVTGGDGLAFVAGPRSRLAIGCKAGEEPTLTVAFEAPAGVRLPVTSYGVNHWNILFAIAGPTGEDGGSMHLFEEYPQEGRITYRISARRVGRSLEEVVLLIGMLQRGSGVTVSSTETDAQGMPAPGFSDRLELGGSRKAIDQALGPGGCLALIEEVHRAIEEGL